MASAEIAFEKSGIALESTRGTAITAPTHAFPWSIIINPERIRAKPEDASGTLVRNRRVRTTQINAGWESEGTIDTDYIPLILQMISKGSITPTTPSGATSARLIVELYRTIGKAHHTGAFQNGMIHDLVDVAGFAMEPIALQRKAVARFREHNSEAD